MANIQKFKAGLTMSWGIDAGYTLSGVEISTIDDKTSGDVDRVLGQDGAIAGYIFSNQVRKVGIKGELKLPETLPSVGDVVALNGVGFLCIEIGITRTNNKVSEFSASFERALDNEIPSGS
jgi:hypothetical protein